MNHPNRWLSVFCVKQNHRPIEGIESIFRTYMRTEKGKEQWKEREKLEKRKLPVSLSCWTADRASYV